MTAAQTIGPVDFDPDCLQSVLSETFGSAATFRLERIKGGQSCPTYYLDWGGQRMVLRKQPNGPILKGAHAIDREYRVLSELDPTDVPVPKPVLYHDNPDTIGTPFYVMERLDGRVFTDTTLANLPPHDREPIWMAVAETLAAIHRLSPDTVGLADYGRPGNYFHRQINRWGAQYHASTGGKIPEIDALHDWLVDNMPADDGAVALCHGDFRLGNLMFHPDRPQVIAVLDWELSTLGHPLADLGFCVMPWHSAKDEYQGLLETDLTQAKLPDEATFIARYETALGRPANLLPFHKSFALFRFAVIFVGIADRAKSGSAADPDAAKLAPLAKKFAIRGLEIARNKPHVI